MTQLPTVLLTLGALLPWGDDPSSKPLEPAESRKLALEWNDKGVAAKEAGKTKDAVDAFQKAAQYDPSDPILTRNLGAAWNDEGVRLLEKEKNIDGAVAAFEEARKRVADDTTVPKNLANALDRRGHGFLGRKKFDLAERDFTMALALDPSKGRYPTSLALVYFEKEDLDEAERRLEAIVRAFDKEVDAWVLLGEACYKKGNLRRAVDALERALVLAPQRPGLVDRIKKIRGEMEVEGSFVPQNSAHFQFHFPPNRKDLTQFADNVATILEEAYWKVGSSLNSYPEGRTQVVFYEVKDFTAVTRADEWVGALYDGKIRVPIRDFEKQGDALRKTLFHEYTHRAIHAIAQGKIPTWLNEGIAQLSEDASVSTAEKRLKRKPDKLLTATQLNAAFVGNADSERAIMAYDQSLSLANYLVEQRGWPALGRYLTLLGRPEPASYTEPKAFEEEFRFNFEELLTRWRLSLGLDSGK